jgi:large subunit ribosomal protein L17
MRHHKAGIKLNRTTSHRNAMFRNMVTSLFKYDKIKTTDVKAKELRRWADHLITLAKKGDLHARRQALAIVREKDVVYKLFDEAQTRYGEIQGGYTRIIKIGRRPGDAALISLIELVASEKGKKKKSKKVEKKKETKKASPETKAVDTEKGEVKPEKAVLAEPVPENTEVKASEGESGTHETPVDDAGSDAVAKDEPKA